MPWSPFQTGLGTRLSGRLGKLESFQRVVGTARQRHRSEVPLQAAQSLVRYGGIPYLHESVLLSRPTAPFPRNRSVLVLLPERFRTTKTHSGHTAHLFGADERQARPKIANPHGEPCRQIRVSAAILEETSGASIIKPMRERSGTVLATRSALNGSNRPVLLREPLPKSPRRLRAARKHFRSLSKWSGTWRDCCR